MTTTGSPEAAGLSPAQLDVALHVIECEVESGFIPGAATAIVHRGHIARLAALGRRGDGPQPLRQDTIFLIASLTKPVVCAGAMLLVQEGRLSLEQPVASLVPEFAAEGKGETTVRHLLTHTSGLPDQLPENTELRRRHAPQAEFVAAACRCRPLFPPGARVSYQSMGILMLAEIVERLSGERLRHFLQRRLFRPLAMDDSTLGLPPSGMERTALSLPPAFPPDSLDFGSDWNSAYWRDFGAPWGGLHSTATDLARFLMHMLGDLPGPLSEATRRVMVRDQIPAHVAAEEPLSRRWGLGFMLDAPFFGDLTAPGTFGHVGATGTLYWADPTTRLACVLLTNQPRALREEPPGSEHLFARYSNAVAAAL